MAQLKSNNTQQEKEEANIPMPKRKYTTEFLVGLFTLLGTLAAAYQAIGLGGFKLFDQDRYVIYAEFDNISGLKKGAPVEIAGVAIGEVIDIKFKDPMALVVMKINKDVKIKEDDIFAVRTKGIIGDKFIKVSRGASSEYLQPGDTVFETEPVVDFEDLIGKFIHNFDNKS